MGTLEILLCIFLGNCITAQSVIKKHSPFFQDVPGFFDSIRPFPFERNFDFTPYDTIFSSWRARSPEFHMLAEIPPMMVVPRIEVSCDESMLTLRVDKRANGLVLTGEEIQLGNGCFSNKELPDQFVFSYSLDECGTTPVMQNGMVMFTNSLHLNLKKPSPNWWQTLPTVHISCIPRRSYLNYYDSAAFPENTKTFNIRAMNPFWTSTAESNVYKRGQVVNLQVSANTRPEQQLFIQSCFISASPEPQTRHKHAVITNKGCTAPLGSPHAVVQFVASNRADVVNIFVNTSYLISEMYIHCSVLLSDQGVNSGSKSCNYNLIQSRWEDLSGNVEVCECCSSRCKGLSVKYIPEDAKAIVSAGPFVIEENHNMTSPEPSEPQASIAPVAATEDTIVSGTSLSRPTQGVVEGSQEPVSKLIFWLPGREQNPKRDETLGSKSDNLPVKSNDAESNDLPELQPATDQQTPTHMIAGQSASELGNDAHMLDLNLLTLVDGWIIPPLMGKVTFPDESQTKRRFIRSGMLNEEAPQELDLPLTAEITMSVLNPNDCNRMADAAVLPQEDANDAQPIIRSKLEFSKGTDGSQTLSYEEEVVRHEGEGATRSQVKQEPKHKGLRSTFLDLLRRLDKAE